MRLSREQITADVVGKRLVQLSHAGEEPWERLPSERDVDPLPITQVRLEADAAVVVVGSMEAQVRVLTGEPHAGNDLRKRDGSEPRDGLGRRMEAQHLGGKEYGIAAGGWIEVIE